MFMSDEKGVTFNTHFRQVPGLGLVAVVPKEWLNKKVKCEVAFSYSIVEL